VATSLLPPAAAVAAPSVLVSPTPAPNVVVVAPPPVAPEKKHPFSRLFRSARSAAQSAAGALAPQR
jgi:hypothetical protein